jgi:uncharacterized protein (DUF362 family)
MCPPIFDTEVPVERRDFLKTTAAAGLAVMCPRISVAEQEKLPDLVVAKGADPAKITVAAVAALGGMGRFVKKGEVVVVKPNIGWDRAPEFAANTNPFVVGAVVKMCIDAGAKKVKVFDNTCNNAKRCYANSGIAAEAQKMGAEVSFVEERKFREVDIRGTTLKKWAIYQDALEADKIINVPVAKQHGLSRLTLSMKNMMGVMGGKRGKLHGSIDEYLVDMARFMKPSLVILDAVRILVAHGPTGGDLKDVRKLDTVIAGTDMVAIDAYGATLFGLKGTDLGYVRLGAAAGVGRMDIGNMKISMISA